MCVHVSEWSFVLAGPGLEAISKRNSLDLECRPPLPMWIVFIVLRVMQTPTPHTPTPFSTSPQSKPVIPAQFEQFSYRCIYANLTPSERSALAYKKRKKNNIHTQTERENKQMLKKKEKKKKAASRGKKSCVLLIIFYFIKIKGIRCISHFPVEHHESCLGFYSKYMCEQDSGGLQ